MKRLSVIFRVMDALIASGFFPRAACRACESRRLRRAAIGVPLIIFLSLLPVCAGVLAGAPEDREASVSTRGSFVVHYPRDLSRPAREIEKLLEESAAGIAKELGLEEMRPIRVYLAPDAKEYSRLHGGRIPEWGIAFSELDSQVLGVNVDLMSRNPVSFKTVVRHELSHLLLAQRVGDVTIPTWFMEGLAMTQAHEWGFAEEWRFMLMVGRRNMPYLEELRGPFPRAPEDAALAYGLSYVAFSELTRDRPGVIMTLTAFIRDTGSFNDAFLSTFGFTAYDFGSKLYVSVHRRYEVPGTLLNAAPYWGALALLFVAVYVIKRARSRKKLEEWETSGDRERSEESGRRIWY